MSFLRRALRAVQRRWVKSLLLLIIFFVIANLVLAGFAIREATNTAKDSARQQLGATLTLAFDQQKAREEAMRAMQQSGDSGNTDKRQRPDFNMKTEPVTEDMAQKVAGLAHIEAYNYVVSASASAEDFDPVETSEDDTTGDNGTPPDGADTPGGGKGMGSFTMPDLTVVGVYSSALYSGFENGSYTLEDGDAIIYSADQEGIPVLIEKTLAAYNDLAVGDTITIGAMADSGTEEDDSTATTTAKTYALTVAGIYSAGTADTSSGGGFRMEFSQPYNQIFLDYRTALDIKANTTSRFGGMGRMTAEGIDSVVYYLDDPLNVDAVIEASQSLDIDWETFTLDANSAAYEAMIAPLNSVASFSTTLVVVVVAAGVVILALILAMWIRERMYETGVLLSLGEGKGKIVCQYVAEVMLVALVAFTLSIGSGMLISQKLGDYLVNQQSSSADTAPGGVPGQMGGGKGQMGPGGGRFDFMGGQAGIQQTETIDELDVSVGWKILLELYGVGLLLVLTATAVPSILVMRYKPKTIFSRAG